MMPLPIERWRAIAESGDARGLDALLADGVIFQSPVVHAPQVGKAITQKYLAAAISVLNNGTFAYLDEWYGKSSAVLEFQCTCEGIVINGVDIIEWDADGRICNFKVMVRPLKAVNALHGHGVGVPRDVLDGNGVAAEEGDKAVVLGGAVGAAGREEDANQSEGLHGGPGVGVRALEAQPVYP